MSDRFTMRIEVWEKDPATGTVFSEYGELYFRDEDNYYAFTEDEGFTSIVNPFEDRIDMIRFDNYCQKLYDNQTRGTYVPDCDVLSIDGYPIESIDIIFSEHNIFPRQYTYEYDNNGYYHKKLVTDYYELIDNTKEKIG